MNFLVDHHLPPALARWLTERGHPSTHVCDLGLDQTADTGVWDYARQSAMVVLSKDDDFLHLANRPGDTGRLVWVRIGNCRTRVLLAAFAEAFPQMVASLEAGNRVVEFR